MDINESIELFGFVSDKLAEDYEEGLITATFVHALSGIISKLYCHILGVCPIENNKDVELGYVALVNYLLGANRGISTEANKEYIIYNIERFK